MVPTHKRSIHAPFPLLSVARPKALCGPTKAPDGEEENAPTSVVDVDVVEATKITKDAV
jgi:hypothetical protein